METPETVYLAEFHPGYTTNERKLLRNALHQCTHESAIRLKITEKKNLQ